MSLEKLLKERLGTSVLKRTGETGSGCISEGEAYLTSTGKVFVKKNSKKDAKLMFDGEFESLRTIMATGVLQVPKPLLTEALPGGGAILVMDFVPMRSLNKQSSNLGKQLARLHLQNAETSEDDDRPPAVSEFGFHCATCCGYLPQDNAWNDAWPDFYCRQRIRPQIEKIIAQHEDKEVEVLWRQLEPRVHRFFEGIEVTPALLHGDLWGGNAAENENGPVVFDPASFYGHSEFDLAIAHMFGGFSSDFFQAYHSLIPKAPGYSNRLLLYQLFHYLNHWNHFGNGYRGSSLSTLRKLVACHQ